MSLTYLVDGHVFDLDLVLRAFGVDLESDAAQDFVELVCRYIEELQTPGRGPFLARVFNGMAAVRGEYYLAFNSRLRAAIKPLLQAAPEDLARLGIYPAKRTVQYMALALSRVYLGLQNQS